MCKGGGSTSTVDPRIMQMLQSNYQNAQNVANRPYQPYTGQLTAGLTPSQEQAGTLLQAAPFLGQDALNAGINAGVSGTRYQAPLIGPPSATAATAQPGLLSGVNQAQPPVAPYNNMTASLMNPALAGPAAQFSPVSFNAASAGPAATANAARIDMGSLPLLSSPNGLGQLSSYINPYTQDVANSTMNLLNQQNQTALNNTNQNATAENAFGGDRNAVADALTNQYYAQQAANTLANLNSQGFNTAAGLLQQNQQMGLQAGQQNLNAALSAAGQNAANRQQANLANANALNSLAGFNAGNQQAANAANAAAANGAAEFNAGALNAGAEFNAGNQQAANLANQGAANQIALANLNAALSAAQSNQSAMNAAQGLNLQGAGLLGTLGSAQNANYLNGVNALNTFGAGQQQMAQNALNAAYQQYLNQFNYPVSMQQLLNSALSGGLGAGTANPAAAGQAAGGLLGGLGSLGSAAASLIAL